MEMNRRAQSSISMAIDTAVCVSVRKCNAALAAGKFNADKASLSWRSKRIVNFSPWRYTRARDEIAA